MFSISHSTIFLRFNKEFDSKYSYCYFYITITYTISYVMFNFLVLFSSVFSPFWVPIISKKKNLWPKFGKMGLYKSSQPIISMVHKLFSMDILGSSLIGIVYSYFIINKLPVINFFNFYIYSKLLGEKINLINTLKV